MSRRTILRAVAIVVLVASLAGIIPELSRSDIERHLVALKRLQYPVPQGIRTIRTRLSSDYFFWVLQGMRDTEDVDIERYRRLDALVALGYLQQKTFPLVLRPQDVTLDSLKRLHATRTNVVPQHLVEAWLYKGDLSPGSIAVTAHPGEMKLWPDIIQKFEMESRSMSNDVTGAKSR